MMTRNWLLNPGPDVKRSADRERLYQELGRFVDLFASTEVLLQLTLWNMSRVPNQIAKAVFSGVKADLAMQNIKRIFEATDAPAEKRKRYQEIFTHVGWISDARNLLLTTV